MLRMLTYPEHSVSSVCFNADGNKLVSGSFDTTLKVWSVGSSGTFECESTLGGDKQVNCVAFSPDGGTLAAGDGSIYDSEGNVRLYDVQTGEVKSTLAGHKRYVPALSLSACSQSRVLLTIQRCAVL